MRKIIYKIQGLLLGIIFALDYGYCYANNSTIDTILKSEKSVVGITALKTEIRKSPRVSAAIVPAAGKILIGRKIRTAYEVKQGAGVIVSNDGLIVTNFHTIRMARIIKVKLPDHKVVNARIIHIMPENDLALIKVPSSLSLIPIKFANSDTVNIGERVFNIGHSALLNHTISEGIVTGLGIEPSANGKKSIELIKVNIDIYKGDSGGPLLNEQGLLIGMMAAKIKNRYHASLAIPSNKIKKLFMDFMQ